VGCGTDGTRRRLAKRAERFDLSGNQTGSLQSIKLCCSREFRQAFQSANLSIGAGAVGDAGKM
jgi:hypothetical protein